MQLSEFLAERRSAIVKKWCDLLFETYPPDSRAFLRRQKDEFSNPVGMTLSREMGELFDRVLSGVTGEPVAACLDRIIRIRAVQDFAPSKALGFVIQLKSVIWRELQSAAPSLAASDDLRALEDRIDDLALQAFDIYVTCRHQLHELRVREIRNEVGRLLERANARRDRPE